MNITYLRARYWFWTRMLCPLGVHRSVKPIAEGLPWNKRKCSFCGHIEPPAAPPEDDKEWEPFAPTETDPSTTNSGDVGGPTEETR